jgi:hypothetical protein
MSHDLRSPDSMTVDWAAGLARALRGALWGFVVGSMCVGVLAVVLLFTKGADDAPRWLELGVGALCVIIHCSITGACLGVAAIPMSWTERWRHAIRGLWHGLVMGGLGGCIVGTTLATIAFADNGNSAAAISTVLSLPPMFALFTAAIGFFIGGTRPPEHWQRLLVQRPAPAPSAAPQLTYSTMVFAALLFGTVFTLVCTVAFAILGVVAGYHSGLTAAIIGAVVGAGGGFALGALGTIGLLGAWTAMVWVSRNKLGRCAMFMVILGALFGWMSWSHGEVTDGWQAVLVGALTGFVFGIVLEAWAVFARLRKEKAVGSAA